MLGGLQLKPSSTVLALNSNSHVTPAQAHTLNTATLIKLNALSHTQGNWGKDAGAVYASSNTESDQVHYLDCVFANNHASDNSGAVRMRCDSSSPFTMSVAGCTFSGNSAVRRGGALSSTRCIVHISDSVVHGSSSGEDGAAVFIPYGGLIMRNTVVNGSSAGFSTVYASANDALEITDCEFTNSNTSLELSLDAGSPNHAQLHRVRVSNVRGGWKQVLQITVTGCVFESVDVLSPDGGRLTAADNNFTDCGPAYFDREVSFTNCHWLRSGAVTIDSEPATVANSTFVAGTGPAALAIHDNTLDVTKCTFKVSLG